MSQARYSGVIPPPAACSNPRDHLWSCECDAVPSRPFVKPSSAEREMTRAEWTKYLGIDPDLVVSVETWRS